MTRPKGTLGSERSARLLLLAQDGEVHTVPELLPHFPGVARRDLTSSVFRLWNAGSLERVGSGQYQITEHGRSLLPRCDAIMQAIAANPELRYVPPPSAPVSTVDQAMRTQPNSVFDLARFSNLPK